MSPGIFSDRRENNVATRRLPLMYMYMSLSADTSESLRMTTANRAEGHPTSACLVISYDAQVPTGSWQRQSDEDC
jgi:hypothetical protein